MKRLSILLSFTFMAICMHCACGPKLDLSNPTQVLIDDKTCSGYYDLQNAVNDASRAWNRLGAKFYLPNDGYFVTPPTQIIMLYCVEGLNGDYPPDSGVGNGEVIGRFNWDDLGPGWISLVDNMIETSSYDYMLHVIIHEMGHALGMGHVLDKNAIMYWSAFSSTTPNDTDAAQFCSIYPATPACDMLQNSQWPDPDGSH